jgi:hypothetical protein
LIASNVFSSSIANQKLPKRGERGCPGCRPNNGELVCFVRERKFNPLSSMVHGEMLQMVLFSMIVGVALISI